MMKRTNTDSKCESSRVNKGKLSSLEYKKVNLGRLPKLKIKKPAKRKGETLTPLLPFRDLSKDLTPCHKPCQQNPKRLIFKPDYIQTRDLKQNTQTTKREVMSSCHITESSPSEEDSPTKKFTSPAVKLSSKDFEDTNEFENSFESFEQEMASTPQVSKYHEFKFKLVTEDPLMKRINGQLRRWKGGECLGNGSYGQVMKAFDVNTGEIFAVKRLFFNPDNQSQAKYIQGLKCEISILQELNHPHIVKYLGSEVVENNFCVYLEYLPGGSIARLLYSIGALPEETVRIYIKQVLRGLEYLHRNGYVHRDIKGANILLDSEGNVKVSDFGGSKKYKNTEKESGLLSSVKGSLPWMAPEVFKQSYGRKADIWSVGCLTLEMLTAKSPWPDEDNYLSMMMKIALSSEVPLVPDFLSLEAKDFIHCCLQKAPEKRKSAKELLKHSFLN